MGWGKGRDGVGGGVARGRELGGASRCDAAEQMTPTWVAGRQETAATEWRKEVKQNWDVTGWEMGRT